MNRATRNNVFGLLLPQSVIPPCPVRCSAPTTSEPPGAAPSAALVTWEPFDFGLRQANVAAATAARAQSEAALKRTQFEVAVATADAYLTLAAAQETVRAAQAGVDRAEVLVADHQRAGERAIAPRRRRVARRRRNWPPRGRN